MNVTVIGLGAVGASIVSLLNRVLNKSTINIQEPNPHVIGRYLDLAHAAAAHDNELTLNRKDVFETSTCIFYCAGVRNAKGASRATVLTQNRNLVDKIFSNINLAEQAFVINLVNPVEAICSWIEMKIGESNTVLSTGTALDSFRLQYLLHDFYKIPIQDIHAQVVGEHGSEMVPLFSKLEILNRDPQKVISNEGKVNLTTALVNSAKSIRSTEKATKFGVAQTAVDIFCVYFNLTKVTMRIPLTISSQKVVDRKFDKPIYINVIVDISRNKVEYVPQKWDENEENDFQKAVASITNTTYCQS